MNRIEKIAKKIVSSVIHLKTTDGIEEIDIRSVEILIEKDKSKKVSQKKKISAKFILDRSKPLYPLQEVKRCLANNPPSIKFIPRQDGRSDPENIGLTKQQAVEIIKNLNLEDYRETLANENPPADLYQKFFTAGSKEFFLYIKFYVKNHRLVCIVSFHD